MEKFRNALVNCETNVMLIWSPNCVLVACTAANLVYNNWFTITFTITDTKLYVPVVTLSTQDNVKLIE